MTQEEKELLLKDLCARLPYGVKVRIKGDYFYDEREPYDAILKSEILGRLIADVYSVKPYLRPLSSMTEEEKIELCIISYAPDEMKTIEEKLHVIKTNANNAADFYNKHHFDYRGLIPMGIALEAKEGMYD